MNLELFAREPSRLVLDEGAVLLGGFATADGAALLAAIAEIAAAAPFRRMTTPGGFTMSVAMTNCGSAGWVSDERGYRYDRTDPESGRPWPPLPALLTALGGRAAAAAGFPDFAPDACLVNRYDPGARLSLHQDRNERDLAAPVVSISLGLPATFQWGGATRATRPRRVPLAHGDVVVWGGPSRLAFHGVLPLGEGEHPLAGPHRYNLTLRAAL
jgi:alkylated DNA repair protein (DNA oxidative demethylase)